MSLEHPAVTNFREYLRIPSVHPNPNYEPCVEFIRKQANQLNLPISVYYFVPNKPVVVITWIGLEPKLESILLNSHMDVVPVFPEQWTYDPFSAHKDKQGHIYARGAQDMKCVGIQYLETIRRFIKEGIRCKRTIHISFVPDEEIGGRDGMGEFVKSEEFKKLNIGCCFDEARASPTEEFILAHAERTLWHMKFHCQGTPGHGSLLHESTAAEKLYFIMNKLLTLRQEEVTKLSTNKNLSLGDVTTINITILSGGVQLNVLPPKFEMAVDCRIAPDRNLDEFHTLLQSWCQQAGEGCKLEFIVKDKYTPPTLLNDTNPWWKILKSEFHSLGIKIKPQATPGATDCRYLRQLGIPAFGFAPMNLTPTLLHANNEYLNENTFLKGIDIYYRIIQAVANL